MEGIQNYQLLIGSFAAGFFIAIILSFKLAKNKAEAFTQKNLKSKQDQFIGLASHYLLTPISIIQTAVSALEYDDVRLTPEKRQHFYDMITRGQQRLWIIAEQLILLHDIDQEGLGLSRAVVDIAEVMTQAITSVDIFAREKNIVIKFTDRLGDVNQAKLDKRRLKQAIIAILDNAIKFSPNNAQVEIELIFSNGVIGIAVKDSGIGMNADIRKHLSERFYRGNKIYNFDYEGMGLGLYIAQEIVRSHRGNINFESQDKKGTIAIIQIPAE